MKKRTKLWNMEKKALQTDLRELSGRLGRCGRAVVDRAVSVCGVCPPNVAHAQTHQKTTKLLRAFLTNPILITKSITIERFFWSRAKCLRVSLSNQHVVVTTSVL